MLPRAYPVLERLFEGLVLLRQRHPGLAAEFHLHFIGTGKSPEDPEGHNIRPSIERHGLQDCVGEYPRRLPYLDVVSHLHAASGVLVLGSTEPHYSPSKIFQSVSSRRPVMALLHEESTAVPVLQEANAGPVLTLTEHELPTVGTVADQLERFIYRNRYSEAQVRWEALEQYSARGSARTLAAAFDTAFAKKERLLK
jgi:hypothetical protein